MRFACFFLASSLLLPLGCDGGLKKEERRERDQYDRGESAEEAKVEEPRDGESGDDEGGDSDGGALVEGDGEDVIRIHVPAAEDAVHASAKRQGGGRPAKAEIKQAHQRAKQLDAELDAVIKELDDGK